MKIYSLNPDSTREKTSITYALSQGYGFQLTDEDGTATVTNPDGEAYHITHWQCDCADFITRDGSSFILPDERHVCKHVLWLSQLHPCPNCKGFQMLRMEAWKVFQCSTPGCYTMTPFQLVKRIRQEIYRQREQEADITKTFAIAKPPAGDEALETKAAHASAAIFGHDEVTRPTFSSRHGIDYRHEGEKWVVRACGFIDSTHGTEEQARQRAERLEVLESLHNRTQSIA